jgi:hypothetical protein
MILFSSLAILSALLAVGIAIRVMLQNDYKTLANLRSGTEAFYFSAAGIEWSKSEIALTPRMPPVPENRTANLRSGSFSVSFVSPAQVGPLAATVVVRSVGSLGTSSHMLQARLTKTHDLADAAIGLRGNAAKVSFGGGTIFISGVDHEPAKGSVVPSSGERPAISTAAENVRELVDQALPASLVGILESSGAASPVATSNYLPAAVVEQLVNDFCASTSAVRNIIPPAGVLMLENQTWGTRNAPQLRCFEGSLGPGDGVTVTGNVDGAGILVIRNADLTLAGAFHWEGLIIVSGSDVGLKVTGPSNKDVLGGVLLNEAGAPSGTTAILDVQGSFRALFSREALGRAAGTVATVNLDSAFAALPFVISQNYWRSVSP